jgi:hypothetical protein
MARKTQGMRDSKGRYVKITILNKIRYFCNMMSLKLEKWQKSVEK